MPADASAPGQPTLPVPVEATGEEVTEAARQEVGNIGFLALGHARALLSREVIGANALKAILASTALAVEMLAKSGFDINVNEAGAVPQI